MSRHVLSSVINSFGALISAAVGGLGYTTIRQPLGHALDSEFTDAILTFATTITPSPLTIGSLRFVLEIGSGVLAPQVAADPALSFLPITEAGAAQLANPTDAYTGRSLRLVPTGAAIDYLTPVYLRIDAHTPDVGSLHQIWRNIQLVSVTMVFEEQWAAQEEEILAKAPNFQSADRRSA